jgi:hypothetical protein
MKVCDSLNTIVSYLTVNDKIETNKYKRPILIIR